MVLKSDFIDQIFKVRHLEKQILKAQSLSEMLIWLHMLSLEWDNLDKMLEELNYQPDVKM